LTLSFPKKEDLHVPLEVTQDVLLQATHCPGSLPQAMMSSKRSVEACSLLAGTSKEGTKWDSFSSNIPVKDAQHLVPASSGKHNELSRSLVPAQVWEWTGGALDEGEEAAKWLSDALGIPAR
jgi:hypothetical protein